MSSASLAPDSFSRQVESRRRALQWLAGISLTLLPLPQLSDAVEAARSGKKNRRKKKRKKGRSNPPTPSPGPTVIPDATCAGANVSGFIIGSNGRAAQSFTAGRTGDLVSADLTLDHFSISDGEYFLRVAHLIDGHPTEQALATARIDDRSLPDGESVVSFSFNPPARVSAGTSYALVLSRAGAGEFTWRGDFNNSCPGRSFFADGIAAPFEPSNQHDFLFTTFVRA